MINHRALWVHRPQLESILVKLARYIQELQAFTSPSGSTDLPREKEGISINANRVNHHWLHPHSSWQRLHLLLDEDSLNQQQKFI